SVTGSTLSGNSLSGSGQGAALFNNNTTVTLASSTISGNSGPSSTGALYHFNGTLTINGSTIAANSSVAGLTNFATTTVKNSILSGNASNCSGTAPTDGGYNISGDATCGFSGTSKLTTDPLL